LPRRLGQHFLTDGSIAARTVRAARVSRDDQVIEVGPGRGALTHLIVQAAPRSLTLVEADANLASALKAKYAGMPWVCVVCGDARSTQTADLPGLGPGPYKVLGNLPYYAASPIIRNFLEGSRPPALMVVMVQREVAAEMAAGPGEMGLLSVGVQLYADVERLFDVPSAAFSPPPRVVSTVVRLTVLPRTRIELDSPEEFFALVRAGFRAPRKQLRNSLAMGLDEAPAVASALLTAAGVDPVRRPETLSVQEWGAVYRAWRESSRQTEQPA
jgi:16S rRNA (adenine1518-N6/adenine1519-N6)-dimethyltransferase